MANREVCIWRAVSFVLMAACNFVVYVSNFGSCFDRFGKWGDTAHPTAQTAVFGLERVVLDIGANGGEDTDTYLQQGFSTISLEPNPNALRRVRARPAVKDGEKLGRATLLNLAVKSPTESGESGLKFYVNVHNDAWSSFDSDVACIGHPFLDRTVDKKHCQAITVNVVSCDQVVRKYVDIEKQMVYAAKIDAEGQERNCLLGLGQLDWRIRPRYLQVEVHKAYPQYNVRLLMSLGYSRFKLVDQRHFGSQNGSSPFDERAVDYQAGNTGWRSGENLIATAHCFGDAWCDLIARKDDMLYTSDTSPLANRVVSLESLKLPHHYLRHKDGKLYCERVRDKTDKEEASFLVFAPPLANAKGGISFTSIQRPTYFIRHKFGLLHFDEMVENFDFRDDATFYFKPIPGTDRTDHYTIQTFKFPNMFIRVNDLGEVSLSQDHDNSGNCMRACENHAFKVVEALAAR